MTMGKPGNSNLQVLFLTLAVFSFISCRETSAPKPKGYFRIDFPQKKYVVFNETGKADNLPLKFEYPVYGNISDKVDDKSEPGWFNIDFPAYKARIYLTYKDVGGDLEGLIEQTYTMNVKNHITKADAINEQLINDGQNRIFGVLYDLKGNTASAVQFYVTDSVRHYLRGSLYFESVPNADSLAPVIDFFREDVIHLIETLKWKEQ
jgi:gliding motility-associated lipoprotein GldD